MSCANWTHRIIKSWSHNSFEMLERIRNGSKARTLDDVLVEVERRRTASCHVWTASSTAEKEKKICNVSCLSMKNGYTTITLSGEDHRVNPAFSGFDWMQFVMRCSNRAEQSREITINYYRCVWAKPWKKKTAAIRADTRQSDFATWQHEVSWFKTDKNLLRIA